MNRRRLALVCGLPLLAALGCIEESSSLLVPSNPFGNTAPTAKEIAAYSPATQEAALRVLSVGSKLVAACPQLALGPRNFATVGSPTPEIFHVGLTQIVITEGLVKQCETEGKLAGVLAVELGKMAADREAQAGLATRNPPREPPPAPPVGLEGSGALGGSDMTRLAELAPYDENRKRQMHPPPPPDPRVVARMLMQKAGYADADLEGTEPLLKTAAENSALEKQMTQGSPFQSPWTK